MAHEVVANFISMSIAFNGGLYGNNFGPRHFSEMLAVDDRWVEGFIEQLSSDDSPYMFSTLPVEILGSVYERFLGSVVQPNGDVKLKPEVRKQGGVYYTPQYVVNHIVEMTVGQIIQGKEPRQIRRIKILDPACGSGSFLIRAFERICEHYVEYFIDNSSRQNDRVTYIDQNGDLQLTTELKRQIVKDNIFGVDLDPQAVEVAQMSLYLKILENETRTTLRRQRALFPEETFLPDLSHNIRVGNSLIGADALRLLGGRHDLAPARPFSWEQAFSDVMATGGFDCVIGNPPYDVVEKDRGKASWPHDVLRAYIEHVNRLDGAKGGRLNLFRFFVVQGLELVKREGRFGMIVPMALLGDVSCGPTRAYLLDRSKNIEVDAFPQKDNKNRRIFFEAKLSTGIITAEKRQKLRRRVDTNIDVDIYPWNSFEDIPRHVRFKRSEIELIDRETLPIPLVDARSWNLCKKVYRRGDVSRFDEIAGLSINRGEINQTIYRRFITRNRSHTRLLKGVEIGAFRVNARLSQGEQEWLDRTRYQREFTTPDRVKRPRIATQRITGVDEKYRVVACIGEPDWFFADSANSLDCKHGCAYSMEYVLALLNSKILQWRFKMTSTNNNVGTNELGALPFREIDFNDRHGVRMYEDICGLVRNACRYAVSADVVESRKDRGDAEVWLGRVRDELDARIYDLFGIAEDERELIEEWV